MTASTKPAPRTGVAPLTAAVIVAALYLARDFFIPLALAILISFLLAPLCRQFERRVGRVASVISVSLLAFMVIAAVGYVMAGQVLDIANNLPKYKTNIRTKIETFRHVPPGPWNKATQTVRELSHELATEPPANPSDNLKPDPTKPLPVEIVNQAGNPLELITNFVSPLLSPLGVAAVVAVFVVFLLLYREDVRDRIIHLAGRRAVHNTTQALDEAGSKVSRYLLMQLIVNTSYGLPIALGLAFIGVPNAILWGLLATVLRFLPYIGPWLAAFSPVLLSLITSTGWSQPVLTIALYIVVELITNNVLEPWLYGSSTGLSPVAIIVAATFWTWMWGFVGLVLAVPLTVCIAVLGKYIPALSWIDVLLGDKPAIDPEARFYQRWLGNDEEELGALLEAEAAKTSLAQAYETLVLPVLAFARIDARRGSLDRATHDAMLRTLLELLVQVGALHDPRGSQPETVTPVTTNQIVCLPALDLSDEVAAEMLGQLLTHAGCPTLGLSVRALASEMIEQVAAAGATLLVISALPPASVMPACYLCRRLRKRFPQLRIIVGMWDENPDGGKRRERFLAAGADAVAVTLPETCALARQFAALVPAAA